MRGKTTSGKLICLLSIFLFAIGLLIGTTQAIAACTASNEAAGLCFQLEGFEVQFTGAAVNPTGTLFAYTLNPLPGTRNNVSIIDILLPVCYDRPAPAGCPTTGLLHPICIDTGDPSGWSQSLDGAGAGSTGWGNVSGFTVAEINFNTGAFFLQTITPAGVQKTTMALKIGNKIFSKRINGPACVPFLSETAAQITISGAGTPITIAADPSGGSITVNGDPLTDTNPLYCTTASSVRSNCDASGSCTATHVQPVYDISSLASGVYVLKLNPSSSCTVYDPATRRTKLIDPCPP